jgi:ankyrin repeat protein
MSKYLPNFLKSCLINAKIQNMEKCWYEKAIEIGSLKTVDKWSAHCLDTTNEDGQTALLYLCKMSGEDWHETPEQYLELLNLILSKKVKINAKDKYGFTSLLWACINANFDFVKALIENGADLNDRNKIGTNPLQVVIQMVCFTDDFEIANYIFDRVPVIERDIVQDLVDVAKNYKNEKVIEWLSERGIA